MSAATLRTDLQRFADRMGELADASEKRNSAIRARNAARHTPAPVLCPAFLLRAAILLAIGAASASGVGSILGYLMGSL